MCNYGTFCSVVPQPENQDLSVADTAVTWKGLNALESWVCFATVNMSSENTFSLNVCAHTCVFFRPRNNNQPCSNEHQGSEIPLFAIKRNYRSLEKKPIPGLEQERYKMGLEHPDTSDCKKALYDRVHSLCVSVSMCGQCVSVHACVHIWISKEMKSQLEEAPSYRPKLLQFGFNKEENCDGPKPIKQA